MASYTVSTTGQTVAATGRWSFTNSGSVNVYLTWTEASSQPRNEILAPGATADYRVNGNVTAVTRSSTATLTATSLVEPTQTSVDAAAYAADPAFTGTYAALSKATEGMTFTAYGHSYVAGQGAGSFPNGGFAYRTANRLQCGQQNMRGVSGSRLVDLQKQVYGGVGATAYSYSVPGQLVLIGTGINDVRAADSNGTTTLAEWQQGLPAVLDLLNAATRYEENDASFAYTGTGWATHQHVADGNSSAGFYSYSNVQNDYYEWTVPAGVTTASLKFYGGQGDYQWKKNGTIVATDLASATKATTNGAGWIFMTRKFTGLTTGDVIRCTMTSTGLLFNDLAMVPSATPSPVLWLLPNTVSTYSPAGSDAAVAAQNVASKAIMAGYPNVYPIDPADYGWTKATMLGSDGLHPNDLGHSFLADIVCAKAASVLTLTTSGLH